jgi:hypothetical protein
MRTLSRAALGGATTLAVLAAQALGVQPAVAATPVVIDRSGWHDFNGDGYDDLAIGVPGESVSGKLEAGAVHVLYGSNSGLVAAGSQFFREGVGAIPGVPETSDHFGTALASGDFDNDGYADLAIGVPGEDVVVNSTNVQESGIVVILHGSPTGLHATQPNLIEGVDRGDGAGALFGSSLAVDDWLNPHKTGAVGHDGLADLAVGAPGADVVNVFSGQRFTAVNDKVATKDIHGPDSSRFGASLASGAFEAGNLELAIGSPDADGGAGAVTLERWPATRVLKQGDGTVDGAKESGDGFGTALAAGDLNGDKWDELVVGVPHEDVSSTADAGIFQVLWTNSSGAIVSGPFYTEEAAGGSVEAGDQFGQSVAVGGIGPKGAQAVAVGAPLEDFAAADVGTVGVFRRTTGTALSGSFLFQGIGKVDGTQEKADKFGWALSIARFDAGTTGDLSIGIPHEGIGATRGAGAVQLLYGGPSGADGTKEQLWSQNSSGVPDVAETHDRFGASLH